MTQCDVGKIAPYIKRLISAQVTSYYRFVNGPDLVRKCGGFNKNLTYSVVYDNFLFKILYIIDKTGDRGYN